MKHFYKISIFISLFFASYSLAMEKDIEKISNSELYSNETNEQVPFLVDQCSKRIADRLARDLLEQRDYTTWLNLEKLPEDLQYNILKSLCKYHSDIAWQYLSDSIFVKRLTDNSSNKSYESYNFQVKLSSNGKFVSAFSDFGHRKIWDINTNKCLFNDEIITASDFSSNSKYIVIACENTIKIWNTMHNEFLPISFENLDSKVTAITISEDNKLIAAAFQDGIVKIFDVENGTCLNNIQTSASQYNVKTIFITAKQRFLITVSRIINLIRIWDLNSNICVKTIFIDALEFCSFNTDAKLIITSLIRIDRGELIVFDATNGEIQLQNMQDYSIVSACTDAKGKIIVLGLDNGTIKLLKRESSKPLSEYLFFERHRDIQSTALSTDNKVVVTASLDNRIKLWNSKTRKCINKFEGDSIEMWQEISGALNLSGILSIAISQNNDLIAAGLNDGVIKIWQIDMNKSLQAILEEIKKNINQEKQIQI